MRKLILIIPLFLGMISCSFPFLAGTAPAEPVTIPSETPELPTATIEPPATLTPTATQTEEPPAPVALFSEKQVADTNPNPNYVIEVSYPYLEGVPRAAVFNDGIEAFINQEVDQFRANVDQLEGEWRQVESFLYIDYEVTFQSNELFSTFFNVSFLVAGAAHPGSYVHSLNYDVAMGRFIELPVLFVPNSNFLEIISAYCLDDLTQQGIDPWPEGLEPILTNFETWNIYPDSLAISFPPYQVAPGAAGSQRVSIPLAHLQDVIRPDGLLAPLLP